MRGAPAEEPGLHIFVANVVAGLNLAVSKAKVCAKALLVAEVGLHCIGDEKVGAAPGFFGEFGQASFRGGFHADAEGGGFCVCHEHMAQARRCDW